MAQVVNRIINIKKGTQLSKSEVREVCFSGR